MSTTSSIFRICTAASALALGLASCRQDATDPSLPALSQAEADSLAEVLTAEVVALSDEAVYNVAVAGLPFPGGPARAPDLAPDLGRGGCAPTRDPAEPANPDGDAVPSYVKLDFSGCVISTPTHTIAWRGTIAISDLHPDVADHSIQVVYDEFGRSLTDLISGRTTSFVQNGTREFEATASELRHEEKNFETVFTAADGSRSSHVKSWSSIFMVDPGGSISPRSRLPSGTWDIDGESIWTRRDRTASLTVTTDPPLHYNAACERAPKFDRGTLTAVVTRGDRTATVTITFTACGEYTVTRS